MQLAERLRLRFLNAGVSTDVWINVKKVDSTANAITIDATGSITIDGSLTITLSSQYDSVDLYCDGTNWYIRSSH
jgi:hypothetical protein